MVCLIDHTQHVSARMAVALRQQEGRLGSAIEQLFAQRQIGRVESACVAR